MTSAIGVNIRTNDNDTKSLKASTVYSYTLIDDTVPANNWEAAKLAGICTGSGTSGSPYTIRDDIFEYGFIGPGHCLVIQNSRKHFIMTLTFS